MEQSIWKKPSMMCFIFYNNHVNFPHISCFLWCWPDVYDVDPKSSLPRESFSLPRKRIHRTFKNSLCGLNAWIENKDVRFVTGDTEYSLLGSFHTLNFKTDIIWTFINLTLSNGKGKIIVFNGVGPLWYLIDCVAYGVCQTTKQKSQLLVCTSSASFLTKYYVIGNCKSKGSLVSPVSHCDTHW